MADGPRNRYSCAMQDKSTPLSVDAEVDFGFRRVHRDEKPDLVRGVFTNVASRYDVMNDVMSLGVHRLWKDAMADWLAPRAGMRILDLAGGTGDIAFRILDRTSGEAEVIICDMAEAMLLKGRSRREAGSYGGALRWVCGDGAVLPFPDKTFDAVTIAFGLRNVADIRTVLREACRVLRVNGRFLCLEFSRVNSAGIARLYDAWSFEAIPRIGSVIARDRDSYQYLVESIRRFPDQETLGELMVAEGFSLVKWRDLSLGVVALHSGWRI